jgi:hypothetical protein
MLELIAGPCGTKCWLFLPYTDGEFETATVVNLNFAMHHEQNGLVPLRTREKELQAVLATVVVGNIYTVRPRPPARRKLVPGNAPAILVFV